MGRHWYRSTTGSLSASDYEGTLYRTNSNKKIKIHIPKKGVCDDPGSDFSSNLAAGLVEAIRYTVNQYTHSICPPTVLAVKKSRAKAPRKARSKRKAAGS